MKRRSEGQKRGAAAGTVHCRNCPLRVKPVFRPFEGRELSFVEWFKTVEKTVEAGRTIIAEGEKSRFIFTILSGWAFRYKSLPDDRRQILGIALPGDLIGMQGPVMDGLQHSIEALTPVRLCAFPRERLWKLYSTHPALAHDLVWLASRGERMADEHLLSLGRRSATQRIAYLILHLYHRCAALDLATGTTFPMPLTQAHVADALGLSLVHTNKTLRRLVRHRLIEVGDSSITVLDEEKLRDISGYDETDGVRRPLI
ncbi:MAG TPA: Crp/Fnr family transcriptional regulator [Hyphomicrobiaceae bacterium]|nr:Crp/Fnr family transcriptional regulator [Hyphomicrobiaceae bacterium]